MEAEEPPALPLPLKCTRAVFRDALTERTVKSGEREGERGGRGGEARLEVREATEGEGGLIAAG